MNKKLLYFSTYMFISIFLSFCSNQSTNKGHNLLKEISQAEFGNDYKIEFNSDSTLALCINPKLYTNNLYSKKLNYFVFDTKIDTIIFQETVLNASVSWKKKSMIFIKTFPEIQGENISSQSKSYYINLATKKKTVIN